MGVACEHTKKIYWRQKIWKRTMLDCVGEHKSFLLEDNEKLKRELKRVREENRKLKHIISYGNISTLETLIDQYMDYSRIHLKKIALEIQLTDYEKSGTDKVMELIEHLECIKEELHKLIAVSEEGAVAHDDILRHDVKIAREMIPKLEEIVQLHIDSQKGAELEKVLTDFARKMKKCL